MSATKNPGWRIAHYDDMKPDEHGVIGATWPVGDTMAHDVMSLSCPCKPVLDREVGLLEHNAQDGRE